ncbi:MAG: tetratricopeptide repeat protein [Patescibacteria group bacterium]|nr:tetratricopeptide repeat protein [Patescibacteria group bacterium]
MAACFSLPAWFWYAVSAACCLLAMGTKETAAVVPLVLLWCDRALLAGSWREVVRRRGFLHGPLLAVLIGGIAYVVLNQAWYAGGGILAYDKVSPAEYAQSQPGVILHYLRLAFWPAGQCLDYGWPVARTAWQIVPSLLVVGVLLGLTVWAAWRRPALGFWGGWFFLFLAPTSSFAPIIDLAFEHRMYLPLAAVAVLVVLGFRWLTEQALRPSRWVVRERLAFRAAVLGAAIVALMVVTHRRNEVYRSEVAAWLDVVAKAPHHARAHINLGGLLVGHGRWDEAIHHCRVGLQLGGDEQAKAHNNLGMALGKTGDTSNAILHLERAIDLAPREPEAYLNLGNLVRATDQARAMHLYRDAIRLKPYYGEAHNNLANLLQHTAPTEAEVHYRRALTHNARHVEAHNGLANLLARQGRLDEAVAHYRSALAIDPTFELARRNLAIVLRNKERD